MSNLPQTLALQFRRTLRQPDAEGVHDLRVAIRRYSQALAVHSAHKKLRRELKALMHVAGEVRNADITVELVRKMKGSANLVKRLHRRRGRAEVRLQKALGRWTDRKFPEVPAVSTGASVADAARKLFKRARSCEDPSRLHRIRIAAKKLRYTLELIAPNDVLMPNVKRLQTRLGRINDYETACAIVKAESGSRHVREELARKQASRVRSFRRFWERQVDRRAWMRHFSAIRSP